MAEDFHSCSICSFLCTDAETLVKHTVREHKLDPNFLVHCSICGASFTKWNSFQRHVQRKHAARAFMLVDDEEDNHNDQEQQRQDYNNENVRPVCNPNNLECEGVMNNYSHKNIDEMQWYTPK